MDENWTHETATSMKKKNYCSWFDQDIRRWTTELLNDNPKLYPFRGTVLQFVVQPLKVMEIDLS